MGTIWVGLGCFRMSFQTFYMLENGTFYIQAVVLEIIFFFFCRLFGDKKVKKIRYFFFYYKTCL